MSFATIAATTAANISGTAAVHPMSTTVEHALPGPETTTWPTLCNADLRGFADCVSGTALIVCAFVLYYWNDASWSITKRELAVFPAVLTTVLDLVLAGYGLRCAETRPGAGEIAQFFAKIIRALASLLLAAIAAGFKSPKWLKRIREKSRKLFRRGADLEAGDTGVELTGPPGREVDSHTSAPQEAPVPSAGLAETPPYSGDTRRRKRQGLRAGLPFRQGGSG